MLFRSADVFVNARNLNDSPIKDIASKRDLLWVDGDPATIQKAAEVFDFKMDMVPKGTYPFMEKDYPTVRQWVSLVAGSHVSDEVAYKYTKAMAENWEAVQKIGGSMALFTPKLMVQKPVADLPYHPGALRYYKEKGWVQ